MPSALVIIAPIKFQDVELDGTLKGLKGAGFDVTIGSTIKGECVGKFGGKVMSQIALKDVSIDPFDRIAFIGGPGAEALRDDPEALRIARETVTAGKVLGAICIAPIILAQAGVLKGKRATVWTDQDKSQARFLEDHGAAYTGETVTVDGLIVTGNGPGAAEEFGRALAGL